MTVRLYKKTPAKRIANGFVGIRVADISVKLSCLDLHYKMVCHA
jgi:hypothetical protein